MNEKIGLGPAFAGQGNTFKALPAAAVPWSQGHCHGGASTALITHIASGISTREPMTIARLSSDFLGPVPVGEPLYVKTSIIKDGRKTQLVSIELECKSRLVLRATVLKTAHTQYAVLVPETAHQFEQFSHRSPVSMPGGFSGQFTIIPVIGGFGRLAPSKVWFHLDSQIVEEHEVDPVVRAIACADFANGLSMELPFQEWLFPTVDLTVILARAPVDDWILIDAKNEMTGTARAFCHAKLSDSGGVFGHSLQTVLVQRRDEDELR